jgi:hypothetical protein
MAMGHAAGATAALAVARGGEVRRVPVGAVTDRLRNDNALLTLEEVA